MRPRGHERPDGFVAVQPALFERVAHRFGKRAAIVAVARRLLEDAWTLLRKDEPFRYVPTSPPNDEGLMDSRIVPRIDSSVAG